MSLPLRGRKSLRKLQKWGVRLIYRNPVVILAWDMGVGKTITVLTALRDLLDDRKVDKVLIVAPLFVAVATWPDEIDEWKHTRELTYSVLRIEDDDPRLALYRRRLRLAGRFVHGLRDAELNKWRERKVTEYKERLRGEIALNDDEIHIVNKEALVWLWEFFGKGKYWPYDMMVVDEASMFKNGKMRTETKQMTRFGAAAHIRKITPRVVLMTGTMAPKGLMNLWGLSFIADLGERLGKSMFKFKERYFIKGYKPWLTKPRDDAFDDITDALADITYSVHKDDAPELPPLTLNPIYIDLGTRLMGQYRELERDLYVEEYDVEAVNEAVNSSKLLQFANGSLYDEYGDDVWVHDKKLEALVEIREQVDEPLLVAYSYEFDLKRIKKRFPKAVVFGEGNIRKTKKLWNEGKIDMLLAHPASVGHGQNIQHGSNHLVWYGLNQDLELYMQLLKRLWRPGQSADRVFAHLILAKGTRDEKVLADLREKEFVQEEIHDAFAYKM